MSVNFLVLAAHTSSSPCTKRFQRNTRSFAPFSGVTLQLRLAPPARRAPSRSERGAGGDARGGLQEIATFDITHALLLWLWAVGFDPFAV